MIVTRLKLTNVRSVEAAEFSFQAGFNLIIGVNGVGKTTALEALAVCLGAVTRRVNRLRVPVTGFTATDIRVPTEMLTVESDVTIGDVSYTYLIHQPRESTVAAANKVGQPREQTIATPPISNFVGAAPPVADGEQILRPLGLLFSTRRAVPSDRAPTSSAVAGGPASAFAEAFSHRELRLGEFAAWIRTRAALASETPSAASVIEAFEQVVQRFLPGYSNLRVSDDRPPHLLITRRGIEIPVRQLSDGERGVLALVLDLTRRLAQANPGLKDPAATGPGVVLIDEIDLHLHPKWQRDIVWSLPEAFPNLQFIATTHSPQVIGEVTSERIQIMGPDPVFSPTHSFGVDSSRVLEEIMDAPPRSLEIQALLDALSRQVSARDFARAWSLVDELRGKLGENDAEVVRARTLLEFLDGDE
jgi:predicted ATP-binding protein involved in virulence